ncbi:MAG: RDD family protein [Methanomassiliicoccales archaeon]|nr:MAG: RDD family protein [Methanomassiliicoccales archaeon]
MVKAMDMIGENSQLQNHWVKRIVAAIIDGIIMFFIWWIIVIGIAFASIFLPGGFLIMPFFSGILWILYCGFLEGTTGATLGKRVMNLQVVSLEGPMDLGKAFIRNITKIYWLILALDWLVGFITDGDPRQRYLDRIANTTVIKTDEQEIFQGAFQPPGRPMPAPMPPPQGPPPYPASQPPYPGPAQQPQPGPQPQAPPQQQVTGPAPASTPAPEKVEPVAAETAPKTYTREELVAMRKDDLVKIARDKGLKISGTKRDLIDRILGENV